MKIIAILRGFPGLGRVVAGLEVLQELQHKYQAQVIVFTYLQGFEFAQKYNFDIKNILSLTDISSIGIIPVSLSGEIIIEQIEKFNPDFILIDGEPLLLYNIRLSFPYLKIITLLNPFDVENPHNKISSQLFFKDCYSKANLSIVHGLWKVSKPENFTNHFYSINTILRNDVIKIRPDFSQKNIVCILGGGTVNTNHIFFQNTIEIAKNCINISKYFPEYKIEVICGCDDIFDMLMAIEDCPKNVLLFRDLKIPREIFMNCKMVIARAGRNTLSELLYLDIPSLIFATGCNIRGSEQQSNLQTVEHLSKGNIMGKDIFSSEKDIISSIKMLINKSSVKANWNCGNQQIIKLISDHFV